MGAGGLGGVASEAEALRPTAVLATGLAGGCAPDVRPGDLIVGSPVGPADPDGWIEPEPALVRRALLALETAALPYRLGRLATVRDLVATAEAKRALWGGRGAVAVDMESAHVLGWARRSGLPGVAVRAVADGPEDRVPPTLAGIVSPAGGLRLRAAARGLGDPTLLADAWRLWRRSRLALDRLARFLTAFWP